MKNYGIYGYILAIALAFSAAMPAHATVIYEASTGSTGVGGFEMNGGETMIDVSHPSYDNSPTALASNWVWNTRAWGAQDNTFVFSFDLTGYDLSTVSLDGLWGVDNIGTASLNGTVLSSLPAVVAGNYTRLHAISTSDANLFNAGLNNLVFETGNRGGPGAFRAAFTVSANPAVAPVPLPATALLLASGLGWLGLLQRRRRT